MPQIISTLKNTYKNYTFRVTAYVVMRKRFLQCRVMSLVMIEQILKEGYATQGIKWEGKEPHTNKQYL